MDEAEERHRSRMFSLKFGMEQSSSKKGTATRSLKNYKGSFATSTADYGEAEVGVVPLESDEV
jgi:hypothetical protein